MRLLSIIIAGGKAVSPAGRGWKRSRVVRPRLHQAGAVALEYILITALVAVALIAVFRMWGKVTAAAVADTAEDTRGALVKEP